MTHLLTGLGRAVHLRQRASLWWVHLCWTASVFFYLAVHWWNLFYSNDGATWSFLEYIYLLLHSVLPFFLAVLLYRYMDKHRFPRRGPWRSASVSID